MCSWLDHDIWGSSLDSRKLLATASFIVRSEAINFKTDAHSTAIASTIYKLKLLEPKIVQLKSTAKVDIVIQLKDMRREGNKSEAARLLNEDEQQKLIRIFVRDLQEVWRD